MSVANKLNTVSKHFPIGYFKSHENQKSFLTNLGKKLQYTKWEDWYKLSSKELRENGGKTLLNTYNESLSSVVMGVFNEEEWKPWLFHAKVGSEGVESRKLRYMEYLYQQLQFKSMEDWYTISSEDILANHGAGFLQKFGNSPSRMVMGILVDHPWEFWRFSKPPRYAWDNQKDVQQYIKYLGELLGYKERSDWYKISARDLLTHYGEPLMRKHSRSPARVVMQVFPDHPWLPFLFRSRKKANVEVLEKYVRQMEEDIGIKGREEWYTVERGSITQIKHHFTDMSDFVDRVLRVVYPDHMWELGNFKNFSKSTTQHRLKELLTSEFRDREVIENYPHPLQFFPGSGEIMTVDVFVPSLRLAFDYNGEQHYKQVGTNRSSTDRQKLDAIKKAEFEKVGYKFVVVPCWWDGTTASLLANISPIK